MPKRLEYPLKLKGQDSKNKSKSVPLKSGKYVF